MSTSQTATGLSSPTTDEKISLGTFGYINARNRQRAYDLVINEFEKSGITQATLANRMGKSPEVISRLLKGPQNWESDTFSSLLFAISGGVPRYEITYPYGNPVQAEDTDFDVVATDSTKAMAFARSDLQSGKFFQLQAA